MFLNNTIEIVLIFYWKTVERVLDTTPIQIAIGSGGWIGKGFLEGTQGDLYQSNIQITFSLRLVKNGFCRFNSYRLVCLFLRVIYLAERQKTKFSRVYGYCVAGILFTHFF
jgi:rod shape determining protein RodA